MALPRPEYRQRVCALAESQWREPVTAVYLDEVRPELDVPGRRRDGTLAGTRRFRRFFWNVLRGAVGGVVSVVLTLGSGQLVHAFGRQGRVSGPADARALGLVDAAGAAKAAWLVYSQSHVAVIDSGHTFYDPADAPPPRFLWHETGPQAPRVAPVGRTLTWPDGSQFRY